MESRKENILLVLGILTLLIVISGATYAYYKAQGGASDIKDVNITTATTDLFTLNIANELSLMNVNQTTLAESATNNLSTSTLATATLKANNANAADPQQYYMYLVADSNPFVYTKDSNTPELLLKLEYNTSGDTYVEITNSNKASYSGVTLEGLTYKTVNSGTNREVSGWDITTAEFVKIIENRAINATQNTTTTDKYRVTITFVNLVGQNQQANTGKTYNGQLVLQKEKMVQAKYWNDGFAGSTYAFPNTPSTTYGSVTALRDGYGTDNFATYPFYIKTTTEHQACLYYNNKEFCMKPNYLVSGDSDGKQTKAKLKADIENAFGITIASYNCSGFSDATYCYVNYNRGFSCAALSNGDVRCINDKEQCHIYSNGVAECHL